MPARLTVTARLASLALGCIASAAALRSEVVDRVAAIVGNEAVTLSEIVVQMRLEAMLNRSGFDASEGRQTDALERLIDRRLIRQDLALTPFLRPAEDEVAGRVDQLRGEEFLGGRSLEASLPHYQLTEADLRAFLEEQIAFQRYVAFRFKTGLEAGPAEIEDYYRNEYSGQRREMGLPVPQLASVSSAIARIVVERRASDLLEQRLMELRSQIRIETKLSPESRAAP